MQLTNILQHQNTIIYTTCAVFNTSTHEHVHHILQVILCSVQQLTSVEREASNYKLCSIIVDVSTFAST